MKERPLELLNIDNLRLDHCYMDRAVKEKFSTMYLLVGAFGTGTTYYHYNNNTDTVVLPTITKEVSVYGINITVNPLEQVKGMLYKDIKKEYPELAKELQKVYNKNFLKEYNKRLKDKRKEYTTKIDKQYKELMTVFNELGSKADITNLEDIGSLYYCEAKEFLDKLEKRISKKANAKNTKIFHRLKELRNEKAIRCEDG